MAKLGPGSVVRGQVRSLQYTGPESVDSIADAMIEAAVAYEATRDEYFEALAAELSRDANWIMGRYAATAALAVVFNTKRIGFIDQFGIAFLCEGDEKPETLSDARRAELGTRYQLALRELLARRLLRTNYGINKDSESCSYESTPIGESFIQNRWSHWDMRKLEVPPL
ncbi:MAG: hypothetical protein U0575_05365 [Phycisphaerales bacterium]